jgi:hypothetical protein
MIYLACLVAAIEHRDAEPEPIPWLATPGEVPFLEPPDVIRRTRRKVWASFMTPL